MACEGDKLRMQNQYAKPLRGSSKKNIGNASQINRSEASHLSLKTVSAYANIEPGNTKEMYIDTDGSAAAIPAQEDEAMSNSATYVPKTKRSGIDKISYDGLQITNKKHSDPEPRNGSTSLKRQPNQGPYRQEFSKSFNPNQAQDVLKAVHEPSFITQATTASGDQTIKNLYSKKQGSSFTEKKS